MQFLLLGVKLFVLLHIVDTVNLDDLLIFEKLLDMINIRNLPEPGHFQGEVGRKHLVMLHGEPLDFLVNLEELDHDDHHKKVHEIEQALHLKKSDREYILSNFSWNQHSKCSENSVSK